MTKIKSGNIRIQLIEMYCQYCKHWRTAKSTGYLEAEDENDVRRCRKSEGTRNCLVTKEEVNLRTKSCGYFELCDIFWCERNQHQTDVKVCISKQQKNSPYCKKCIVGVLIMKSYLDSEDSK